MNLFHRKMKYSDTNVILHGYFMYVLPASDIKDILLSKDIIFQITIFRSEYYKFRRNGESGNKKKINNSVTTRKYNRTAAGFAIGYPRNRMTSDTEHMLELFIHVSKLKP